MSRRLLAEIDKALKEARATIEQYDDRWRQLRRFNQSQVGVKERMWEESRREQMRGKKHAVRTATLELLDFKHVCDSKAKIEADMETLLRKLHRHRQQLTEWLGLGELRTQQDELKDLRRQIELRYKRGRVFYCLGQSSEDTEDGESGGNTHSAWILNFIEKLNQQADLWEADIETLAKQLEGPTKITISHLSDKRAQLEAFVELHKMHTRKLEGMLRAIRGHSLSLSETQADEIQETLRMYIEDNDDLTVVVADEVYHDIEFPTYESDEDEQPVSDPTSPADGLGSMSRAASSGNDDTNSPQTIESLKSPKETTSPPKQTTVRSVLSRAKSVAISPPRTQAGVPQPFPSPQNPQPVLTQTQSQPNRTSAWQKRTRTRTTESDRQQGGSPQAQTIDPDPTPVQNPQQPAQQAAITRQPSGAAPITSSHTGGPVPDTPRHMVVAEDIAAYDWEYTNRPSHPEGASSNKTLEVRCGQKLLIVRIDPSGWTFAFIDRRDLVADPLILHGDGTKQLSAEASRSLPSGWFPNTVRASVKAAKKQKKAEEGGRKSSGADSSGSSNLWDPSWWDPQTYARSDEPSLLQRLNLIPNLLELPQCSQSTTDMAKTIDQCGWWWRALCQPVRVGTVRVIQLGWQGQLMESSCCSCADPNSFLHQRDFDPGAPPHDLLYVSQGDRVLVEEISEDFKWVFCRRVLDGRVSLSRGWIPSYLLTDPTVLTERLACHLTAFVDFSPITNRPLKP